MTVGAYSLHVLECSPSPGCLSPGPYSITVACPVYGLLLLLQAPLSVSEISSLL